MHMSSSLVSHGHGPTALQCFQTLHRKGIIPVKVTCALLFPRYHQRPPRSRSFAGLPLPDLGSRSVLDAWELLYVSWWQPGHEPTSPTHILQLLP